MDIYTIGSIIKNERLACGLTQKALATASHVSRVTIVNLENGKSGDIGAVKLSEIAQNLATPMFSSGEKMDYIKVTLSNINTSYQTNMSTSDLEELMLSGKVKAGFEGQVLHLIDETPTALITGAVKQLAIKKNINSKAIWKNMVLIANQFKSTNKFWSAFA